MDQSAVGQRLEFDKTNALLAALVAVISFIIYRLTVAPTLSYWDCGEFIACAHILGNPHPPGSPLFVLIGRVFDMLPIGSNVAFRINLVSVVSSTFSAMFTYLVVVRLVSAWYEGTKNYRLGRLVAYVAGITGAMFMAFGETNWSSAVEAEVYGLSMLMMMAMFWLGLKWFEYRYSPKGQRIVLLVAFLAMLSVGVHLTVFLIVPFVAVFFSLKRDATRNDWGVIAGFFLFELILIMVLTGSLSNYKIFLGFSAIAFAGILFYLRNKIHWPVLLSFAALSPIMIGFYPFLAGLIIWTVIATLIYFATRKNLWRLAVMIMIAGTIGMSVHIFIPVRSAQHPVIDENTPSRSFTTFVNFLDRKQYGNISMTERMFARRGAWENQFGDHARMGFWRFFKDQYSPVGLFPLFFIIGMLGMIMMAVKKPSWGYIFIALFLVASVGLVLYMNFADGTKYNPTTGDAYQEVRDRDYFFTPAFIIFGMAIGLGMGGIMELVRQGTVKLGEKKNRLAVVMSAVLVLTGIVPANANFFTNNRSRNHMAYSYAYNLLSSCEPNAILFTSGDNDTFPVWCIQEAYNFRKDVRVVNFSLLNTDWYTWQLSNLDFLSAINAGYNLDSLAKAADASLDISKTGQLVQKTDFVNVEADRKIRDYIDSMARKGTLPPGITARVPISLTDDQILWEDTTIQGQTISRPVKPFYDAVRKRAMYLFPTLYDGKPLKVATLMMENIILTNKWEYPIYFSSVSGNVRESPLKLTDRLYREGIVVKLTPDTAKMAYNVPRSDSLFFQVYNYINLSDTTVAQNENATGIALTYPEKMLDFHSYVAHSADSAMADSLLDRICEAIPSYWRARMSQRDMYRDRGDTARANEIVKDLLTYENGFRDMNPNNIFFYQFLGTTYYILGDNAKAEENLLKAWDLNIDTENTFRTLLTLYASERRPNDMLRIAQQYKQYHADDPIANDVIRSAQALMQQQKPMSMPQTPPPIQVRPSGQPTTPATTPGGGQ